MQEPLSIRRLSRRRMARAAPSPPMGPLLAPRAAQARQLPLHKPAAAGRAQAPAQLATHSRAYRSKALRHPCCNQAATLPTLVPTCAVWRQQPTVSGKMRHAGAGSALQVAATLMYHASFSQCCWLTTCPHFPSCRPEELAAAPELLLQKLVGGCAGLPVGAQQAAKQQAQQQQQQQQQPRSGGGHGAPADAGALRAAGSSGGGEGAGGSRLPQALPWGAQDSRQASQAGRQPASGARLPRSCMGLAAPAPPSSGGTTPSGDGLRQQPAPSPSPGLPGAASPPWGLGSGSIRSSEEEEQSGTERPRSGAAGSDGSPAPAPFWLPRTDSDEQLFGQPAPSPGASWHWSPPEQQQQQQQYADQGSVPPLEPGASAGSDACDPLDRLFQAAKPCRERAGLGAGSPDWRQLTTSEEEQEAGRARRQGLQGGGGAGWWGVDAAGSEEVGGQGSPAGSLLGAAAAADQRRQAALLGSLQPPDPLAFLSGSPRRR